MQVLPLVEVDHRRQYLVHHTRDCGHGEWSVPRVLDDASEQGLACAELDDDVQFLRILEGIMDLRDVRVVKLLLVRDLLLEVLLDDLVAVARLDGEVLVLVFAAVLGSTLVNEAN